MEDSDIENWKEKDKDFLIAHYREVGEESRLYDRLIWEVPSIAIAIVGALLIAAYAYAPNMLLRTLLTGLATIWAFGVIIFAVKHEFFVTRQKTRLTILEEECFGILNLQRFTDPRKFQKLKVEKSHWEKPKGLQHLSAHSTLNVVLWIMFLCVAGLTTCNLISLLN